jgi:L-fuculose-phosphate aldolase
MPAAGLIADLLVDVSHRLYARGFVVATDGNVSARLDNGNVLTTRTSVNKGAVTASDLVEVDLSGRVVSGTSAPSSELPMHLFVYRSRPDVNAVVHAHPVYATGFAAAHRSLDACLLPEVILGLGSVPLAKYATPSTDEVAESLAPFIAHSSSILLANHGVVTFGSDLMEAYFRMEKTEQAAHITFVARMLGGEQALDAEKVERLRSVTSNPCGCSGPAPIPCVPSGGTDTPGEQIPSDDELRNLVRHMIASSM